MSGINILCEDGPLIAVSKPAGLPTQGVPASTSSLEIQVKEYLRQKYDKPGNVYLGIPHRLDRPVSGVVVFARNSKSAARLAEQFRLRQVRKWYLAVIEAVLPADSSGTLTDWLRKIPEVAHGEVVPEGTAGAKWASLNYRVLQTARHQSLVLIELHTGRMHQIRLQFASRGWPIAGDRRYGASGAFGDDEVIALHAARLDLRHPVRYDAVSLRAPLPEMWTALGFDAVNFDQFEEMIPSEDQTAG